MRALRDAVGFERHTNTSKGVKHSSTNAYTSGRVRRRGDATRAIVHAQRHSAVRHERSSAQRGLQWAREGMHKNKKETRNSEECRHLHRHGSGEITPIGARMRTARRPTRRCQRHGLIPDTTIQRRHCGTHSIPIDRILHPSRSSTSCTALYCSHTATSLSTASPFPSFFGAVACIHA